MKTFRRSIAFILAAMLLLTPVLAADESSTSGEIVDPYRLYSYEQMLSDLDSLEARYPELISLSSIGKSVEGRDIPMFTLGTGTRDILICASMHAREYISTNFVMYMAEQYCIGYTEDQWYAGLSYKETLDNVRFVIVPMLNPDGVTLAQNGIENAENKDALLEMALIDTYKSGYYAWKANINGVDLNRNWPYNWSQDYKVTEPASANFNGTAPCTEPEVIAMKKLIDSTPFYMFCSFHTSGEVIYWIDTTNSTQMANEFSPMISKIANWIGYTMLGYENIANFGGYMTNYARATYEKPCFTVELCPIYADYPYTDYVGFAGTVNKVLPIGLLMAEAVMKMEAEPEPTPEPNPIPEPDVIEVLIEGEPLILSDVHPVIESSRVLVPLRAVCEAVGLNVIWEDSGLITVTDGTTKLSLSPGSTEMLLGDSTVILDAAPKIHEGRTLLPIRAVLEAFGYALEWDSALRTVSVTSKSE